MAATETSLLTQIERVPVDELVLYPGNPRRGDLDAIAESMATNAQYVGRPDLAPGAAA